MAEVSARRVKAPLPGDDPKAWADAWARKNGYDYAEDMEAAASVAPVPTVEEVIMAGERGARGPGIIVAPDPGVVAAGLAVCGDEGDGPHA